MENSKLNIKCFLDPQGRTVIGNLVNETENSVDIEFPMAIVVRRGDTGNISFQMIPILFKELLADDQPNPVFTYQKSQIALSDAALFETRIIEGYMTFLNVRIGDITTDKPVEAPKTDAPSNSVQFPSKKIELFDKQ